MRLPLRLLWPWVEAVAVLCRPLMSWHLRRRLEHLLRQAGAPSYWSPHHLCAWQAVLAMLAVAAVVVLLHRSLSVPALLFCAAFAAALAAVWPWQRLRECTRRRKQAMLREFPFMLDMITLCVEAGLNLHGALGQAAANGPPGPLRDELRHMLSDIRAGASRQQALAQWAQRCGLTPLHHFVGAVAQAEQSGMNLGPVLRAQADQRRSERFLQAEKRALEAPVKMMFPLVICIFPCSFLIIAFPIVVQFTELWK
ncbi:type II secretion system F family protein [Achromobacter sp. F4_2707]|uniref:type II secretion system F family protein n=1 Tax=Achromobacter sp. F4_2707 TaxID=3114286 RepID=UPI0039C74676